jgi:hypothetical protein
VKHETSSERILGNLRATSDWLRTAMHIAIHNNDVYDLLPMSSNAVYLFHVMIRTDNPLTVTAEVAFLDAISRSFPGQVTI